jgi:tetratricopeptide (TPR) repeat protein
VWLEQGLLGLLALLWLLATAYWPNQQAASWRQPALASLAVLLLHGLVDDVFYGGDGAGIFLLFVPFALLARPAETSGPTAQNTSALKQAGPRLPSFLGPVLALLALAALLLLPSWQAALQANLGALAQTRAELAVYDWPEWPIQDALRRSSGIDLAPALAHYQTALARNPANATANRRLGQIELSLGQYEAARKHLEAAYAVAPDQRATRQLLGESYAVGGEVERAAALWRTVDTRQGQLQLRQWWYEHIGESQRAAWVAEAAK